MKEDYKRRKNELASIDDVRHKIERMATGGGKVLEFLIQ